MLSLAENPPIYYTNSIKRLSYNSNARRNSAVSSISSYRDETHSQSEYAVAVDSDIDASSTPDTTIHVKTSTADPVHDEKESTRDTDLIQWLIHQFEGKGLGGRTLIASPSSSNTICGLDDRLLSRQSSPIEPEEQIKQTKSDETEASLNQSASRSAEHYYPRMYQSVEQQKEKIGDVEQKGSGGSPVDNVTRLLRELKERSLLIQRQNDAISAKIHRAQELIQNCNSKILRSDDYNGSTNEIGERTPTRLTENESGCAEGTISTTTATCSCERRFSTCTSTGYSSPVERPQSITPTVHIKAPGLPQLPRFQDYSIHIPALKLHEIKMNHPSNRFTKPTIQSTVRNRSVTHLTEDATDYSSWTEADTTSFTSQESVLRFHKPTIVPQTDLTSRFRPPTLNGIATPSPRSQEITRSNGLPTHRKLTSLILHPFRKKSNNQANLSSSVADDHLYRNRCISLGHLIDVDAYEHSHPPEYCPNNGVVEIRTFRNIGHNRIRSVDLLERSRPFK